MNYIIMAVFWCGFIGYAQAATLYRWVNPEGVVTYQNTPPPQSARGVKVIHLSGHSSSAHASAGAPKGQSVVLYQAPNCTPCRQASTYLSHHKIPFKTIDVGASQAALQAMKKKTGSTTIPTITVGAHVLMGYLPSMLAKELTVAGYLPAPKQ
ncbi:MAG TPA: glutaredoxin family protein [Acidiferrobacter sp.]|nr:glutaredoxin family protein [Acidiferrobacter sp.]